MGYDLIGYTVVGDVDLEPYKEQAVEQAKKVMMLVHSASDKFTEGELTHPLSDEELDYFTAAFPDIEIETYPEMFKDKLDYIKEEIFKPESFVDDFVYFWKYPHHRDTNYRYYKGRQIVFAGGESHGDEPTGRGYTLLKVADMLGLFPIFHLD